MNRLPLNKRTQIITLLVEGNSIRSCTRISGVSKNAILKLLVEVGTACQKFHNETVIGLNSQKIQCDEIWSFVYSKEKNIPEGMEDTAGDIWTWTALDADSKLIVSWAVGSRDAETANEFMNDVASRLTNRVQLTTDGHKPYLQAVYGAFGNDIALPN